MGVTYNRDIRFRAKRVSGDWVYGDLLRLGDRTFIVEKTFGGFTWYEVDPTTVGQFTGLQGTEDIYEGDVVKCFKRVSVSIDNRAVLFTDDFQQVETVLVSDIADNVLRLYEYDRLEVIGNIHDTPELKKQVSSRRCEEVI